MVSNSVLQPFVLAPNIELRNRLVLAPLYYEWAFASRAFYKFFESRARGGVGMAVVPVPTHGGLGDLADDAFKRQSEEFIERMNALDCVPVPQIFSGVGEQVNQFSTESLAALPQEFACAARSLVAAGYKAMEIHGAHHALFMALVSPGINKRTDDFGGDFENRIRLVLATVDAIKQAVGQDICLIYRLSATEFNQAGVAMSEVLELAARLETLGLNCLDVSCGGTEISPPYSDAPDESYGEACFAPYAAQLKQQLKIPVIVAGRINDLATANRVVDEGMADLVAMGRTLVREPNWLRDTLGLSEELVK